ncbi:hypothetical protein [Aerosakkonema funiforme]|uniref:hypothetical protein n=1 Tax=Aerosakkonema funiforme TaxID=1246630 RepID=UPI0035B751FA
MPRLYDRAFAIMAAEVKKCSEGVIAGEVQRNIVLKRLERLRSQAGAPLSYAELRETVIDFFLTLAKKFSSKPPKSTVRRVRGAKSNLRLCFWRDRREQFGC